MLLSHRYNFLFVHIAKTGGTSARKALSHHKWRDPYRLPMWLCSRMSGMSNHKLGCKFPRHSKIIAAQEMLPKPFFDQLYKFAFVRNPWDLQVSSYHHIKRERPHLTEGFEDFESFLKWKLNPERPYQYHIDTSIELQSDYLIDLHGKVLVDFIGRYENLAEDFAKACQTIGINGPELPHERKATDRDKYRNYYTDETQELVHQHFRSDIELFGYAF